MKTLILLIIYSAVVERGLGEDSESGIDSDLEDPENYGPGDGAGEEPSEGYPEKIWAQDMGMGNWHPRRGYRQGEGPGVALKTITKNITIAGIGTTTTTETTTGTTKTTTGQGPGEGPGEPQESLELSQPPLIGCKSDKDCETLCKNMANPKACSGLTICDKGPNGRKKRVRRQTDPDIPKAVCNDQKACTEQSECPNLEMLWNAAMSMERDASYKFDAPRKCHEGKCIWVGEIGE